MPFLVRGRGNRCTLRLDPGSSGAGHVSRADVMEGTSAQKQHAEPAFPEAGSRCIAKPAITRDGTKDAVRGRVPPRLVASDGGSTCHPIGHSRPTSRPEGRRRTSIPWVWDRGGPPGAVPIESPAEDHAAFVGRGMASHRDTAIDLKDCVDQPVRVKLAGGREGERHSREGWILCVSRRMDVHW